MTVYVTHCDGNYITRVISLEESLRKNGDFRTLYIIAHDQATRVQIESLNLKFSRVIELSELEQQYPELRVAKMNRSRVEYIFCLSPFVVSYAHFISGSSMVTYLDADLYFFKSPEFAMEGFSENANVSIIEHSFHPKFLHLSEYGTFNVGWMSFRMQKHGNSTLDWWKSACIESTSTLVSEKVYADQKYLNEFSSQFNETQVNVKLGLNVAPWNIENYLQKNTSEMEAFSNLVFFHFSGLRMYGRFVILGLSGYSFTPSRQFKRKVYKPYVKSLYEAGKNLNLNPQFDSRKYKLREILKIILHRDFILNL